MAEIVTNPNWIQIDDARIQKGSRDIIPMASGVRLQNVSNGLYVDIPVAGSTIDGDPISDVDELLTYLDSQGFKPGGTGPIENGVQSVTGAGVDNTDPKNPVISQPNWNTIDGKPAVIGAGATQAAARTALGLGSAATTSSSAYATSAQGNLAETALQPSDAVDVSEAGKVVRYSNTGAVNTDTPQFPENCVNLSFLNLRLPEPPASGTHVLRSVDGVVSWVADE